MGEQTSKTTSAETGIILKQKKKTFAWLRLVQPHTLVLLMLRKYRLMEKTHEQTYLVGAFNPSNRLPQGSR